MLVLGFCVLSLTVALGACLAAGRFTRAALLHGGSGLAGLAAIALAVWRGTLRGPFAIDALVLLTAAFCVGAVFYVLALKRRPRPGLAVLLHGMAGGLAYLLLAGFVFGR